MKPIILALLALGSIAHAADWVSLFDGKSLAGWHVAAKPEDIQKNFWKVQDGFITCDSRGHKDHDYVWLMSDKEYADFDLKLKVRGFRDSTGNSGVQVRSRYDSEIFRLDGPQADVHPPAPWRTGLIYDETRETRRWIYPSRPTAKVDESYAPKGWTWKYADEGDGWNDLSIVCRGTKIKTTVNGVLAADFNGDGILNDEAHRKHNVGLKGYLALQLHVRDDLFIQYKEIYIKPFAAARAAGEK